MVRAGVDGLYWGWWSMAAHAGTCWDMLRQWGVLRPGQRSMLGRWFMVVRARDDPCCGQWSMVVRAGGSRLYQGWGSGPCWGQWSMVVHAGNTGMCWGQWSMLGSAGSVGVVVSSAPLWSVLRMLG